MLGLDPRIARAAWTVLVVAVATGLVYLARQTVFIVILAVFFAYFIHPAVLFVQRRLPRLPRTAVLTVVFLVVCGLVVSAGSLIGSTIADEATTLGKRLPELMNDPHAAERIPLPNWLEPLRARIVEMVRAQVVANNDQALPFAQRVASGVLHFVGNIIYLIVVPILGFLLIKDASHLHTAALGWLSAGEKRAFWTKLLGDVNLLLGRYIRALLLLALAVFVAYGLVFTLMDVPYSLLLAAIAAPLEFIPFLGPLGAAAIVAAICVFSGYDNLLWVLLFIAGYRLFQDYVLSPYLMSEGVEVHPVLVIVGLMAGEEIGGVSGMFLAIPLIAVANIVARHLRAAPRSVKAGTP
ncbi:MAG: AI-2E family transporter [Burkholderiales bacterium]